MIVPSDSPRRFSAHTHALIAGRSDYSAPLATLPAVERELSLLVAALTDPLGCAIPEDNVTTLSGEQCTADRFLRQLDNYQTAFDSQDVLIVYFAGHGRGSDSGFDLLLDACGEITVDSEKLDAALGRIRARGVLLILDCCGGGGFAERAPGFFQGLGSDDFRVLLSSTREHQSSWELSDPPRSLFTQCLISIIRGDSQLDPSGGVYLTQLIEYLRTSVVAESKALGTPQEPMFSGSYSEDPLLFLHRDLTLARVRVRYARVTREQMKRRVRLTAAFIVGVAGLLTGTYWAWMDSHRYLSLDGDQVALTQGYPGWSGFGLPKGIWQFDVTREHLKSDSQLFAGRPIVFNRNTDVLEILHAELSDFGHLSAQLWAGDVPEPVVSTSLAKYLAQSDDPSFALRETVLHEDVVSELKALSNANDPAVAYAALIILSEYDPSFVGFQLEQRIDRGEVGEQLNLLAQWRSKCTPEVESWLHAYAAAPANYLFYPTVVDASLRSGCQLNVDDVLGAHTHQLRTAALGYRLANSAEAPPLTQEFALFLQAPSEFVSGVGDDPDAKRRLHRFVRLARYLGSPVCPIHLYAVLDDVEPRNDLMALLLRGCTDAAIVSLDDSGITVQVGQTDLVFPVSLEVDVIHALRVLESVDHAARADYYQQLLSRATNPDAIRVLAEHLLRAKATWDGQSFGEHWDRPDVQVALLRWASQTNPEFVAALLVDRLTPGVPVDYLALSAALPLYGKEFMAIAQNLDTADRTVLETLHGPSARVTALLISPNRLERETAGHYLIVREDRNSILRDAFANTRFAPQVLKTTQHRIRQLEQALDDLRGMPDWACWWRLELLKSQRPLDYGLALAVETHGVTICQNAGRGEHNG